MMYLFASESKGMEAIVEEVGDRAVWLKTSMLAVDLGQSECLASCRKSNKFGKKCS